MNARVREYFEKTGMNRGGGPRMWLKSGIILAWLFASYVLLVFWATTWWQALPLATSLALAVAGVGFNIQHDGGHGAYSRKTLGNRLSAWTLDMVGGSSYMWRFKHTIIHHHYTNIEGVDEDIKAEPILRMAPGQKYRWFHRFQHIYMWGLYAFVPPKWVFYDDFVNVVLGRMGAHRVPRPKGVDLAILICGKVLAISLTLVVPMMLHSWSTVLLFYGWYCLVLGVTLSTTFQLAHCVEEASFYAIPQRNEAMEKGWVEHQLATTVNFAPKNRFLTWYLGGLNYQVEHHLLPRISHVHYPALAPIVSELCKERGVPHQTHETLGSALRSHIRLMKRMGRPPRTARAAAA